MSRVCSRGSLLIAIVAIAFACAVTLAAAPAYGAELKGEPLSVFAADAAPGAADGERAGGLGDDLSVESADGAVRTLVSSAAGDADDREDEITVVRFVDGFAGESRVAGDGELQALDEAAEPAYEDECVDMYRMYNPNSGEHFYTASVIERVHLIDAGWTYEGVGWASPKSGIPVHRLYSGTDHHYTMDVDERDALQVIGWIYEGIGWFSDFTCSVPMYRQFNPNVDPLAATNNSGSHNYTVSKDENDSLVGGGWNEEGVAWYALRVKVEDALYLGAFFSDTPGAGAGFETVLCYTRDGMNFRKLSTPFTNAQNPFHDPSIMYKDGWFYVLSNWNRDDDRFYPMISYSSDLVNWSEPEGLYLINEGTYEGISFAMKPFDMERFDVVAPEWFLDDDGSVYIIFSAGFFGEFHGVPAQDKMEPYVVRVNITHDGFTSELGTGGKPYPKKLTIEAEQAFEIQGLDDSENYIDGSLYKENGVYYLLIKKDGVINQIYENSALSASGWRKVNDNIAIGNEGPSLAKIDGAYMLYTDRITTFHGHWGVQVSTSVSTSKGFSRPVDVVCRDASGAQVPLRHGTVMRVEGDARAIVEKLRAA